MPFSFYLSRDQTHEVWRTYIITTASSLHTIHHRGYEREKDTPLKLDALLTGTCGSDMVQLLCLTGVMKQQSKCMWFKYSSFFSCFSLSFSPFPSSLHTLSPLSPHPSFSPSPSPPQTCMKNWSRYDVARTGELGGHETPLEDDINQEGGSQTTSNVTRSAMRLY